MKIFFSVAALLTFVLGVAWLFYPTSMLSSWGASPDGIGVYMARRYGALMFGYTAILWHSRAASASPARSAILAGGAIVTTMMAILTLMGLLTRAIGPAAWSTFVIEAVLAVAFIYYFVTAGGSASADPAGQVKSAR